MKLTFLVLITFSTAVSAFAQQTRSCKKDPRVVDECFKIHGRVRVVNGAGTVIWHIGTDRKLEVQDEELIPQDLTDVLSEKGDVYSRDVFGDFEVCPFTKKKPGEMQMVCVESASHLVVRNNTH
jgi:hypothetical protein